MRTSTGRRPNLTIYIHIGVVHTLCVHVLYAAAAAADYDDGITK